MATTNATADVLDLITGCRRPGRSASPARPTSTSPAGSRSCPGTCRPTGSGWWTGRWRGSSPTSPVAGCSRWPRPRSSRPTPPCTRSGSRPSARRRYVSSSRTDEFGLRTVIARVEAGDAVWVEAIVARVAEIIAPRYPDATADELRSIAFGWLARPAELLQLLLEHRDEQEELDLEGRRAGRTAFPADLLDALRAADLSPLAPKAVLYVHLHEAAIHGARRRRPGRGPRPGHADRAAVPAGPDHAHREAGARPVRPGPHHRLRAPRVPQGTGPPDHRRRLLALRHLHQPPTSTTTTRSRYDDTGPPGQTGTHNSGPLGRRHHRCKTHAGYRSRQCGAGRYVWLTPHGLGFLVDHRGTRPDQQQARPDDPRRPTRRRHLPDLSKPVPDEVSVTDRRRRPARSRAGPGPWPHPGSPTRAVRVPEGPTPTRARDRCRSAPGPRRPGWRARPASARPRLPSGSANRPGTCPPPRAATTSPSATPASAERRQGPRPARR